MNNVIVLFELTIKKGKTDDYLKTASLLKDSLKNAKGFIKSERFSSLNNEGKLLSMSIWEDEESVKNWRNLEAHRTAQKHGIMNDFVDDKITVLSPIRTYTMDDRSEAPTDSNKYFEV